MLIQNFTYMQIPIFFKKILDEVMGKNRLDIVIQYILLLVFYTLISVIAMIFMRKLIIGVSRKIEHRFRNRLFDKLLFLDYSFFLHNETGDIVSRCSNDLNDVRTLLGPGIMYVPNALSRLFIFLPVLFELNTRLLLILSLMYGILVVLIVAILPKIRPLFRQIQEFVGSINNRTWQVISGINIIKLYGLEKNETDRFKGLNREYISKQMTLVKWTGLLWPFFLFLISMIELVVLLVGGKDVIANRMSIGEFLQFTIMVAYLTFPVLSLGWIMSLMQQGISAMKRINYILEQPDRNMAGLETVSNDKIRIKIKNLNFKYPGVNKEVLKGISMNINSNSIIGLTGPIGSGKSTLLNLLNGILKPESGMVFINGTDIINIDPESLMEKVAMVPQQTFLFSKSLEQNILMGKKSEKGNLESIIQRAGFENDLKTFPDGYQQAIGERGITLSGGQKQRIAIARALMKGSPLLIFDDALSSVDSKTESLILEEIIKQRSFKTLILVSHRISSLKYADIIYFLQDGQIVESGKHNDLIRRRRCYYRMAKFQQLEMEK